MAMRNPVHPGAIVREDCLKPLGLSISEGAKRLGVGRQTLSNLVNEKASIWFRSRWPTGYRRRSAQPPRRGSACSWPVTLPARVIWNRRSRSNESSPHRLPSTAADLGYEFSLYNLRHSSASRALLPVKGCPQSFGMSWHASPKDNSLKTFSFSGSCDGCGGDLTGVFCTSRSERESHEGGSWTCRSESTKQSRL